MGFRQWLYLHNFRRDPAERARNNRYSYLLEQGTDEADAEMLSIEETWNNYPKANWWFVKPQLSVGRPYVRGGDEFGRLTRCFGFGFTGQICVASSKAVAYHRGDGTYDITFEGNHPTFQVYDIALAPGVVATFNTSYEVHMINIDPDEVRRGTINKEVLDAVDQNAG